jgi:hypothetical protein
MSPFFKGYDVFFWYPADSRATTPAAARTARRWRAVAVPLAQINEAFLLQ